MKSLKIILILIFIMTVFACQKKETVVAKSMEELYKENGIPVKVEKIESSVFTKYQTYFAELEGYKQTTVYSKVSDYVADINANVGDYVKKDDVIIKFPKTSVYSTYYQTKAQLENIESSYQRTKKLVDSGSISQQQLNDLETQLKIARQNFESASAMLSEKAPYNGMITEVFVSKTKHIESDLPLYTISDLTKLIAVIWVNEDDIDYFEEGMKAKAIWKDHEIEGKVQNVALAMDKNKKAFRTEVIFENKGMEMKAGITAEIEVQLYQVENVISVPREVVKNIMGNPYVWIAENGKASKRNIKLGQFGNGFLEIKSGLNVGDELILEGHSNVYEDGKLSVERM